MSIVMVDQRRIFATLEDMKNPPPRTYEVSIPTTASAQTLDIAIGAFGGLGTWLKDRVVLATGTLDILETKANECMLKLAGMGVPDWNCFSVVPIENVAA